MHRLSLLLLCWLLLIPVLGEILLRGGITFGLAFFRNPALYADPHSNDDFFKLRDVWRAAPAAPEPRPGWPTLRHDPQLGWAYPRTADNPLGVLAALPYPSHREKRPLLFFGDSFVAKGEHMEEKLPQLLDPMLPEFDVYNFGVGGYGLDQILLRCEASREHFENPLVLFGLLTVDIDRTVLHFRSRPKPYFELRGTELKLRGVPTLEDPAQYLREHPVEIRSYFLAVLREGLRYFWGGLEAPSLRDEKQAISSQLIERAVDGARTEGLDLVFVIFSTREGGGWRKRFLIGKFERLGARYIDVEALLLKAERRVGRSHASSFDSTSHHTLWANRAIARGIAASIGAAASTSASGR